MRGPDAETEPGPGRDLTELAETHHLDRPDGVRLLYQTLGEGERTVLLAHGLGGRLYAWEPLIRALLAEGDVRILTWDYRGLFRSSVPERTGYLSIVHHAEDARAVLDAEDVARATPVGWSMGVQVALELASLYPERVERQVLINGTYGQVFQTGFQPLFRMPFLPAIIHRLIERLQEMPRLVDTVSDLLGSDLQIKLIGGIGSRIWGPQIERAYRNYIHDIFQDHVFSNYLRLFQELDAHSVYHHLPEIEAETLLVSGGLDVLTPSYQSKEMARRLPDVRHLHVPLGQHFILLEYPDRIVPPVVDFILGRGRG